VLPSRSPTPGVPEPTIGRGHRPDTVRWVRQTLPVPRRGLLAAVVLLTPFLSGCGTVGTRSASGGRTTSTTSTTRRTQPSAAVVPLRPTALAVGPNGNLYVADQSRNQILERLPDGTFVVVAGTGAAGYSGDGGPGSVGK